MQKEAKNALLGIAVTIFVTLAFLTTNQAWAIPLPDNSSCTSTTQCLKITNNDTTTLSIGIRAEGKVGSWALGGDYGVIGQSTAGTGVWGASTNYRGVYGSSTNEDGVYGVSNSSSHSGVSGSNNAPGGYGVFGLTQTSGNGAAIYGHAGNSSTSYAGYFYGQVRAFSYSTASDARLKKEVQNLTYGLQEVRQLRPVTYKWKNGDANQHRQLGLIAQEVQNIIPELVDTDAKSGMLSVNYQALGPLLVKALQEQQAVIKKQEARIAALEAAQTPALSSNVTVLALGVLVLGLVAALRGKRLAL